MIHSRCSTNDLLDPFVVLLKPILRIPLFFLRKTGIKVSHLQTMLGFGTGKFWYSLKLTASLPPENDGCLTLSRKLIWTNHWFSGFSEFQEGYLTIQILGIMDFPYDSIIRLGCTIPTWISRRGYLNIRRFRWSLMCFEIWGSNSDDSNFFFKGFLRYPRIEWMNIQDIPWDMIFHQFHGVVLPLSVFQWQMKVYRKPWNPLRFVFS